MNTQWKNWKTNIDNSVQQDTETSVCGGKQIQSTNQTIVRLNHKKIAFSLCFFTQFMLCAGDKFKIPGLHLETPNFLINPGVWELS